MDNSAFETVLDRYKSRFLVPYVSFEIVVPIETSMLKVEKSCNTTWEMSLECCAHNTNVLQILSSENKYVTRNNIELCLFITSEFVQVTL